MCKRANSTLLKLLSNKIADSILALQVADDTTVIATASQETLITLKLILRIFTKVSGLQINFDKSNFVLFNLEAAQTRIAKVVLEFTQTSLPVTYLGMPLTVKTPEKQDLLPLVEKIETRLEGWKGKLISMGGRLQLAKSVLSAIPIYFMTCSHLPKWVINRIDYVRRTFLWGGSGTGQKGVSLINWSTVILPIEWGGMGLKDLNIQHVALLLQWLWRAYNNPCSLWTTTITMIRWTGDCTGTEVLVSFRVLFLEKNNWI